MPPNDGVQITKLQQNLQPPILTDNYTAFIGHHA